ncbi:hypothetical protein [Aeromonas salmonicida]|uniref:hypothetical protein n=1 Tax=Aeromonas salmonicida TaxID=645 RepID=UPI0031D6CB0F
MRPVGDGVKRSTHDADLRGRVVLRSLGFQLVPFKLHRFRKQRHAEGSELDVFTTCTLCFSYESKHGVIDEELGL